MHLFAGFISKEERLFPRKTEAAPGLRPRRGNPGLLQLKMRLLGSWCHSGAIPAPFSQCFPCASSKRNSSCSRGWTPRSPEALGQPILPITRLQGQPKTLVLRVSAAAWGFLGERQGAPGVLPERHAQPGLRGHAAGGEGVVLGLKLELAVAASHYLIRLALRLPGREAESH